MTSAQRTMSTEARMLMAACFGSVVIVPLMTVWMLMAGAGVIPGLFLGVLSMPFAMATSLLAGLPLVLLYRRVFGRVHAAATIAIGGVLGVGVVTGFDALFSAHTHASFWYDGAVVLFAVAGMLIAGTAWWMAFCLDFSSRNSPRGLGLGP